MGDPALFEPRGDFIEERFELPSQPSGEIVAEEPADTDARHGAFPFSRDSVGAAVEAARRAWPGWRDAPPERRAEALQRFANALREESERLATAIAREVGKPLWEARTEVAAMIGKVDITLGAGLELVAERHFELGPGQLGRWSANARGVAAVLGPFNFPGHLVHGHVIPALATGNTVVIKPSERTPAVGQLYAELAARAGLPEGVLNLVQGDGASGAALAAHPDVDAVLFTGSWAVGRALLEATLDQPAKLVALEMGGKNGALVCADADLERAAAQLAFGVAVTAGQRCSATSRVFAERAVADALCERLGALLSELVVGDPLEDGVFMGPLISAASRERHAGLLARAGDEGAECVVAGGPWDGPRTGHWVRPSLHRISRHDPQSAYQRDEHFVPDAFVCPVDSLDEAIAALEATDYGLVTSVFSGDRAVFERVRRETRHGLCNWNTSTVGASSKLPFGGVKHSGNAQPAGVTSTLYCTYPVASLEHERPQPVRSPGFPGGSADS